MKNFINKYSNLVLIVVCLILSVILFRQCDHATSKNQELVRAKHNIEALNDTIRVYKDKNNITIGEIQAMEMRLCELSDSLYSEKKNKPSTIVNTTITIHDTISAIASVDTTYSVLVLEYDKYWEHSYRHIKIETPYSAVDTVLFGNTTMTIDDRIWAQTSIVKKNDGKYYVQVKSDIQYIKFDNINGFVISDNTNQQPAQRAKTFGIGIHIGAGLSAIGGVVGVAPYIGVGLSYTPKWLQF